MYAEQYKCLATLQASRFLLKRALNIWKCQAFPYFVETGRTWTKQNSFLLLRTKVF